MMTLIENATILTVDPVRTIYTQGSVVVENHRITDVGEAADVGARCGNPDQVIDGRGKVLLPGFVSAHNHVGYAVFRGRAEDVGYAPTHRLYLPMSGILAPEERRDIGMLAIAELLRGGVTCILEMEEDGDLFAPFIDDVGMRAGIGVMVNDVNLEALAQGHTVFDEAVREQQLAQAIGCAEQWHGKADGRIRAVMAATSLSTSSPELMRALRDTADRLHIPISVHLGIGDQDLIKKVHGKRQFEVAKDFGMLAEDVIAVHCFDIDDEELGVLTDSGAHLAHCPLMNQFRGEIAPVQTMRERGMNVGLGIDNYFSDYFDVIRSCIAVARIRAHHPEVMQAPEALELATINAARTMGLDSEIGSIEIGKRADLQLVDMRRLGLTPVNDPLGTLIYHGHAKDVDTVMVDGRIVVRDGRLVDVDESAMLETAGVASDAAWRRFAERHGGYVAPAPT